MREHASKIQVKSIQAQNTVITDLESIRSAEQQCSVGMRKKDLRRSRIGSGEGEKFQLVLSKKINVLQPSRVLIAY